MFYVFCSVSETDEEGKSPSKDDRGKHWIVFVSIHSSQSIVLHLLALSDKINMLKVSNMWLFETCKISKLLTDLYRKEIMYL